MIELLKLLFSKDAKELISILRSSKEWKKDIKKFSGKFQKKDKDESYVLIEWTIAELAKKNWSLEEQKESRFIISELINNSFEHGLPNKEYSVIDADILVTTSFLKVTLKDYGQNFDLEKELELQEAFNTDSKKHKGLSLINQITPEIYQEDSTTRNVIVTIKRKGLRPLKTEIIDGILVFKLGSVNYINEMNYKVFIDRLSKLKHETKIIIDFSEQSEYINPILSRAMRTFEETLEKTIDSKNVRIAIIGLENEPWIIKEYFEKRFDVFESFLSAYDFLSER